MESYDFVQDNFFFPNEHSLSNNTNLFSHDSPRIFDLVGNSNQEYVKFVHQSGNFEDVIRSCSQLNSDDSGYNSCLTESCYNSNLIDLPEISYIHSDIEKKSVVDDNNAESVIKTSKSLELRKFSNEKFHPYKRNEKLGERAADVTANISNYENSLVQINFAIHSNLTSDAKILHENLTKYSFDNAVDLFSIKSWGEKSKRKRIKVTFQVQKNMFLYILRQGRYINGQNQSTWRQFLNMIPSKYDVKDDLSVANLCDNWRKSIASKNSDKIALLLAHDLGIDFNYGKLVGKIRKDVTKELPELNCVIPLLDKYRFLEFLNKINEIEKNNDLVL